jgi:class 3 adenylate cyclase/tetratricopeptide (TPR) repeat protein
VRCDTCQAENPETANYCSNCGAKLSPQEAAERRFATVLFADLKEFTVLCEEKDPEEVTEIIKELFARFDNVLKNFRVGYHEYIGDAVLALFGVPTAYGNDAEQAVRAGLAMQEEIKKFVQEIGVNIEMRVGINSGEMIYGDIPGKTTVTGDAVNTTQRLSSAAEPGKILISEATTKLVEGRILTRPLPSLKLKGKKEKVSPFEIIGPVRKIYPAFLSPMVNRNKELAKLREIFKSSSGLSVATIAGKVGIGKSRLVFEFQRHIAKQIPQAKVIVTRCTPYHTLVYQPIMDLTGELLGIEKTDSAATVMQKLKEGAPPKDSLSKHFLGFFFGVRFPNSPLDHLAPEAARGTAFVILKNLLEQTTAEEPIVLVLEDVHDADSGTIDFLEHLMSTDFKGRMMIVLTGRPAGIVEEIKEGERKGNWNLMELSPLSESQSRSLITNFFKREEIKEEVMQALVKRTEGNPLFIEEFIKDYKENASDFLEQKTSLPDSLWASLEARIDSLAAPERAVLRTASVIGRIFWEQLLERLEKNNISKELNTLEHKQFIYAQHPSQLGYEREYAFGHELLREAAYKTLLKKQRKDLHTQIFHYLEERYKEKQMDKDLFLYLAAYHSEHAEQYDKAAGFFEQSGDSAERSYAHQEAIEAYGKAIETIVQSNSPKKGRIIGQLMRKQAECQVFLCDYDQAIANFEKIAKFRDHETKISGLLGLAETWEKKGNFDRSIGYSERAQRISKKKGLIESEAQTSYCVGAAYSDKGLYDEALRSTQKACDIYESIISKRKGLSTEEKRRLKRWLAKSLSNIGTIRWYRGNYEAALEAYEKTLKIGKENGDKNGIAIGLNNIGLVHGDRGDYDAALGFHKQSLEIRREIGDKRGIAASLNNIGIIYDQLGDKTTALGFYEQSIEIYQETGGMDWAGRIMCNIGNIHYANGDYDRALDSLRRSLKIGEEHEDRQGMVSTFTSMGCIHRDLGNYQTALTFHEEGEKMSRELGVRLPLVYCLGAKGVVYNELDRSVEALEVLKEALSICEELRLKSETCETLATLSQTLCRTGDTEGARAHLDRAWKIAEESRNDAAKSSVLIGYVRLYRSTHEHESASKSSEQLLAVLDKMNWKNFSLAEALYFQGLALAKLKEKKNSKKCLSRALSLAKKMGLKSLMKRIEASST